MNDVVFALLSFEQMKERLRALFLYLVEAPGIEPGQAWLTAKPRHQSVPPRGSPDHQVNPGYQIDIN